MNKFLRVLFGCALALSFAISMGLSAEALNKPEQKVNAISEDGRYQLVLTTVSQGKSPWDPQVSSVTAAFRMQLKPDDAMSFLTQLPEDVFLDGVDILEAVLPIGKDVARNKKSKWTNSESASLDIHHFELGKEQEQILCLRLEVTLVTVTEWEELEAKDIQKGIQQTFPCGPFELICEGNDQQVSLSASAGSDFQQEHEAYRKRMPLAFVNSDYALHHVLMTDSSARSPTNALFLGAGGSVEGIFSFGARLPLNAGTDAVEKTGRPPEKSSEQDIRYPISIKLALPMKYKSERVIFEFKNFKLPPLQREG